MWKKVVELFSLCAVCKGQESPVSSQQSKRENPKPRPSGFKAIKSFVLKKSKTPLLLPRLEARVPSFPEPVIFGRPELSYPPYTFNEFPARPILDPSEAKQLLLELLGLQALDERETLLTMRYQGCGAQITYILDPESDYPPRRELLIMMLMRVLVFILPVEWLPRILPASWYHFIPLKKKDSGLPDLDWGFPPLVNVVIMWLLKPKDD
jgi:hypothetical protein